MSSPYAWREVSRNPVDQLGMSCNHAWVTSYFDLRPVDGSRDDELFRLIELGATTVADRRNPDGTGWVVLADPEGNEFCILRGNAEVAAGRT